MTAARQPETGSVQGIRVRGSIQPAPRAGMARSRLSGARAGLRHCVLCAHRCGVDRERGDHGLCRAGVEPHAFSLQMEAGDELGLVPTFAIALSGCDLRCDFCITGEQSWNPGSGRRLTARAAARAAASALESGARSVMVLGGEPTIFVPWVLEFVSELPAEGHLVWKTNGHGTAEARSLLQGLFNTWVIDYKFGNDACARRLARVDDYTRVLRENLLWAAANENLIVRHLVMPGHLDCCWRPAADWLATRLPHVTVSLRNSFWPAWRSRRHGELLRAGTPGDGLAAARIGEAAGLRMVA